MTEYALCALLKRAHSGVFMIVVRRGDLAR